MNEIIITGAWCSCDLLHGVGATQIKSSKNQLRALLARGVQLFKKKFTIRSTVDTFKITSINSVD